ncbi:uncharacterized protein LOC125659182 [Ostrea edulis]|uniref:uncharacterized protein LOC125659182 n=1 Tax=Ostrea edulis TaxID=37623 RepID=UPI0024AEFC5D|nr:uncharacterized protein LOC125659182 [Ostrea edulis]
MASCYFTPLPIYPTNPENRMAFSIFPTTARINDIEQHTIIVPTVSQRKTHIGIRLSIALSISTNLLFLVFITWMIFTQYDILQDNVEKLMPSGSGLGRVDNKANCQVDLSSAMCMPCQDVPAYMLWQGKFVKVLNGNSALCCRKTEHSLKLLFKVMKNVQLISQRKSNISSQGFNSYYAVLPSEDQFDLGTLPLTKVSKTTSSNYCTKITVGESGWYKIIAEVTTLANRQICPVPSRNFVRVVSEDPIQGRRTLLQKNWTCPDNITGNLINPVHLIETFYFPKHTIVYVEVSNRAQIYNFRTSNYVALV